MYPAAHPVSLHLTSTIATLAPQFNDSRDQWDDAAMRLLPKIKVEVVSDSVLRVYADGIDNSLRTRIVVEQLLGMVADSICAAFTDSTGEPLPHVTIITESAHLGTYVTGLITATDHR